MTARHWTEDELIARLYGVGPQDKHIETCGECAGRLRAIEEARSKAESSASLLEPGIEFFTVQRRKIYNLISNAPGNHFARRFAPALAASLVLALGLLLFNQRHTDEADNAAKPTDVQLVEYVGGIATNPEPAPVAPLQALFEE